MAKNYVDTYNGRYTVGMTKREAQNKKMYKCKVGIDFVDLDTDKSGKLSTSEINEGIKKQKKRDDACGLMAGAGVTIFGMMLEPISAGFSTAIVTSGTAVITHYTQELLENKSLIA